MVDRQGAGTLKKILPLKKYLEINPPLKKCLIYVPKIMTFRYGTEIEPLKHILNCADP